MYQLYVIDSTEHSQETYSSLMKLVNHCKTPMGRRMCKQRILLPLIDPEILSTRYKDIEALQQVVMTQRVYENLHSHLGNINDLERHYRRMSVGLVCPCEFYNVHQSYHYILCLYKELQEVYPEFLETNNYQEISSQLTTYQNEYSSIFHVERMATADMSNMNVCHGRAVRVCHGCTASSLT